MLLALWLPCLALGLQVFIHLVYPSLGGVTGMETLSGPNCVEHPQSPGLCCHPLASAAEVDLLADGQET